MSVLQGASNVHVAGGTFVATNTIQNSHVYVGTMIQGTNSTSSLSIVLEKLSAMAAHAALYDSAVRFDPPRCHPNTRERLLNRLELWMRREAEQEISLIWLHGGAGAGKSAIMQSLVERCVSDCLVLGTFFFNRSDESRNNAEALVPTLAYQVLRAYPTALDVLGPIIHGDPLIFKASPQKQALELLVRPLQYLFESGDLSITENCPHVVVIDGLDECSNPQKQALIINIVANILHDHHLRIQFIVASRPEQVINIAFHSDHRLQESYTAIVLEDDLESRRDIRHYIEDTFDDIVKHHPLSKYITMPWPSADAVDHLVLKSSGHFIFASTAMQYITSSQEHPPRSLKVVLGLETGRRDHPFAHLDALYLHLLESATYTNEVLAILRHSSLTHFTYSVDCICVMLEYSREDMDLFLADVGALVSISDDKYGHGQVIHPKHASIGDFLQDKTRSQHLYVHPGTYQIERIAHYTRRIGIPESSSTFSFLVIEALMRHLMGSQNLLAHSTEIGNLLWQLSPRDVWNYATLQQLQPSKSILQRHRYAARCVAEYMSAILQYSVNGNALLYGHHFKTYLELFAELSAQRPGFGNRALVPLIYAVGSTSLELVYNLAAALHAKSKIDSVTMSYMQQREDMAHPLTVKLVQHLAYNCGELELWRSRLSWAVKYLLNQIFISSHHLDMISDTRHIQWLSRKKAFKHISSCSRLAHRSYDHLRAKWKQINSQLPTVGHKRDLARAMAHCGVPYAIAWRLSQRLVECDLFLRALTVVLPHVGCSKSVMQWTRRLLPRSIVVLCPRSMSSARKAMDEYTTQCHQQDADMLDARIEGGSFDALIERARSLILDGMD